MEAFRREAVYGFGDDHINQFLIDAHEVRTPQLMYLVHPSGRAVMNKFPPGAIAGNSVAGTKGSGIGTS
jgi:hypothetical protein